MDDEDYWRERDRSASANAMHKQCSSMHANSPSPRKQRSSAAAGELLET